MTHGKTSAFAILLAGLFLHSANGQSSLWNGSWNLDANSQEAKPGISFFSKPDGFSELVSSTVISRFRCDGKPYPMLSRAGQAGAGDAICVSLSKTSLDITFLGKDRPRTVGHLQVLGDAKGLIYTLETGDIKGKKEVKVRHYVRVSGADGLVGGWRNVDPNPSQILNVILSRQAITLEYPLAHQTATYPLSGAEIHAIENGVPVENTQTLQFVDAHNFRLANLNEGIVIGRATFSLSPDGSTITEHFWLDQHPEEVAQYTYHRTH